MLNERVRQLIDESVLCWLATASNDGRPNVSPKEIFATLDDATIVIANVASPNSARNIRENPQACVSFIDIFTQKGYQVSGPARYVQAGTQQFDEAEPTLTRLTDGLFPFKSVFAVSAESIREIIAPRYRFFPDTTESQQIDSAMRTYGVRPAKTP